MAELKTDSQLLHSHSQSIAKLETQVGQLANALTRREEGKLLSQPVANPKGQYRVENLQASDVYHEQAKIVVTLRNG